MEVVAVHADVKENSVQCLSALAAVHSAEAYLRRFATYLQP